MDKPPFHAYEDRQELAETLAELVFDILQERMVARGEATLVVSGGNTPVPFLQALGEKPLLWDQLTVLVADERWVAVDDELSNERLVREHLYRDGMNIISLAPEEPGETLEAGSARIEEELNILPKKLDVVILGMGDDGHTASLFPNHPQLAEGLNSESQRASLPIRNAPKAPPERITLTASRLLASSHLLLHITGEGKRETYERAAAALDADNLPISYFLHQETSPVTTYWSS